MLDSYFKYLSVAGATAVLANRTLRWTTCPNFNDPSDMQIDLNSEVDRDNVTSLALDKIWRRLESGEIPSAGNPMARAMAASRDAFLAMGREGFESRMRQGVHETIDALPGRIKTFCETLREPLAMMKVICFSSRKDSILMWSHYAESHAGLVLEFRNAPNKDSPYQMAKPVQYSDRAPRFADEDELSEILAGEPIKQNVILDRMVYTKASEWSYEMEWRLRSGLGRQPGKPHEDVPFGADELHAVYFGCKVSQSTVNLLQPLLRHAYPHTEIWQARRESHTYELAFDPVLFT